MPHVDATPIIVALVTGVAGIAGIWLGLLQKRRDAAVDEKVQKAGDILDSWEAMNAAGWRRATEVEAKWTDCEVRVIAAERSRNEALAERDRYRRERDHLQRELDRCTREHHR